MKYLLAVAILWLSYRRLLTYLHIFQQEEYDSVRFLRWLIDSRSVDRRMTLAVVVVGLLELAIRLNFDIGAALLAAAAAGLALVEQDARKASKKPLAMTQRARRIFAVAFSLAVLLVMLYTVPGVPLIAWILPVQALPLALPAANQLLRPYESRIQKRFWEEARSKLDTLRPTIVAITGSFGKTSTKHLLAHVLERQAPTLMTPGSVNTPMGISRIVREQLGPHHRYFVCEMGAYGPGSIARLCELAPPDFGAITAIGAAHYERFRSLETVAKAKFELGEAVAARRQGALVVYEQALEFEASRRFQEANPALIQVVGHREDATYRIVESGQDGQGIFAQVVWQGERYLLKAPIFGEHHISNLAMAFAVACSVGVPARDAAAALETTPQIPHRLEVKRGMANSILIDDAYNSNPIGFRSALHLLDRLRPVGGRCILVTPGMVELGAKHDEEHREIGRVAAETVDVLLPVVPGRIPALVESYRALRPEGLVVPCADFPAAQNWLSQNVAERDAVLLENDLPDVYERILRL